MEWSRSDGLLDPVRALVHVPAQQVLDGLGPWERADALRTAAWRAETLAELKQSDRRDLSAVTAQSLKRSRSGSNRRRRPFRLKGSLGLVAEPMLDRRSIRPSRRRIVRSAAERPFSTARSGASRPPA
jgi:hypothetical protein